MTTFSTLLDMHGNVFVKAREVLKALGYKPGTTAVRVHVDADRRFAIQEILRKPEIASYKSIDLLEMPKHELESNWISEPGCMQLLWKSRLPVAKELERWLTGEVLPSLRKTS